CLTACPTQALRVHRGGPLVLAHLCIECTACVAACPTGALGLEAAAALPPPAARALVLPPAVLAQFGSAIPPAGVVAALRALGFGEVRTTGAWERAQAEATAAAASSAPLLAALCPAVVSLVETRFPSLLEALAPYLTPLEAAAVDAPADALIVCVCPAQRSALVALGLAPERLLAPQALRDALLAELHAPPPAGAAPLAAPVPAPAPAATAGLPVHGLAAVRRTLEELEDGQLTFGGALELWACPYGCFGSGLLPAANPAVAAARWRDDAAAAPAPRRRAVPYSARPGLRLDPDMAAAVAKLRRIDELTRALPGRDCGQCGAPTCRALAEDVVLERAPASACAHQAAAAERSA
ncbi:MAG TPA: (Fe-S)-binding protein, partial [Polyangia bacterium]